ncbi:chemotaxis protein MotB [Paraburkholderia bannensis]|uniref:Chemotaxis protein MotB n=1 Tax=Paraburkholderia bannensis TaxID=765414 RepID=A0A7W9WV66_9BURK|nr:MULTISPECIES: OmpA family protein [Paraburkholderia]MBB3260230.1 chemotaxis protein MotB [Paraburkholderia sp. WP4_3_2]MBB6105042.1 chemotaxis protein MotB [Paraburkholderia bannensis]
MQISSDKPAARDLLAGLLDHDEEESGEHSGQTGRWLLSYADLVTTMMVLFLALYAMQLARRHEQELRAQSQAVQTVQTQTTPAKPAPSQNPERVLLASLGPLRASGEITVSPVPHGMEIGINARILFNAGDAALLPESFGVLSRVAGVLAQVPDGNILVEGHTDSTPIANARYASNWELSSARAGAVVRYLVERGVEPHRLAAIGRADNFPLVAGTDPASRALNRRVTIVVQY